MRKKAHTSHIFTIRDIFGISAACIFSLINIYLFISYTPSFTIRNAPTIAHINFKKNDVKRKLSGSLTWSKSVKGEALFQGDEIFTGDESQATVTLIKEKIKLSLSSNSLVKIEYISQKPLIEIKKGEAEIFNSENLDIVLKTEFQTFNIKATNKTNFKVTALGENVGIKSISGDLFINNKKLKSEAIGTFNEKSNELNVSVRPELLTPANDQIIYQESFDVFPKIKPFKAPKTQKIVYEISKDKNFEKIYSSQTSDNPNPLNQLAVGNYYIRIKYDDGLNLPTSFQIKNNIKFINLAPYNNESLSLQRGAALNFSWNSAPEVIATLLIRNKSTGESFSFISSTSKNSFIPQADGEYTWKLEGSYKGNTIKLSEENLFFVKFDPLKKLINPQNNQIPLNNKRQILFEWENASPQEYGYKILDTKVNTEIISGNTSDTKFSWTDARPGEFNFVLTPQTFKSIKENELIFPFIVQLPMVRWNNIQQVESMDKSYDYKIPIKNLFYHQEMFFNLTFNGKLKLDQQSLVLSSKIKLTEDGKYCLKAYTKLKSDLFYEPEVFCFTYKYVAPFPELLKAKDQVISLNKKSNYPAYTLKCPSVKRAISYEFIVSKDQQGKQVIFKQKSNIPEILWVSKRSGVYYLQYKVFDDAKRESLISPVSKIIFPISPLDNLE